MKPLTTLLVACCAWDAAAMRATATETQRESAARSVHHAERTNGNIRVCAIVAEDRVIVVSPTSRDWTDDDDLSPGRYRLECDALSVVRGSDEQDSFHVSFEGNVLIQCAAFTARAKRMAVNGQRVLLEEVTAQFRQDVFGQYDQPMTLEASRIECDLSTGQFGVRGAAMTLLPR